MASHPRLELQPAELTPNQPAHLEEELGPAVLDACFSLWREYSELSEKAPSAFPQCEQELLTWYAELQFKTRGGWRCSQCGTPVRHALKVRAERCDTSTRTYLCLCTRCLVAEEALSWHVLYRMGGEWVASRRQGAAAERTRRRQRAA